MQSVLRLGLVLLILGLTACEPVSPGSAAFSESPIAPLDSSATPSPAASAGPTIDWFPSTPTSTPLPTRSVEPTQDLRPELGPVLLQDDFSQPGAWKTGQTSLGTVAYGKNELSLAIPNVRATIISLRAQPVLGDFYLEITATPSLCRGSDAYGLLLRASSANDYYRWILTCDGQMRLERVKGQLPAVVQDWTPRAARPDATRLSVWASGTQMRFLVDDIVQFEVHDPIFLSGSLGVFARSNGDNSLTVSFSDLVVRQVQPAARPTPTLTPKPPAKPKH
jgi:hypothetical protein